MYSTHTPTTLHSAVTFHHNMPHYFSAKDLLQAAELGNVDRLKEIVKAIDELQMANHWMTQTDKKGRTPLHLASIYGYMNVVRFIVKEIVDSTKDLDLRKEYINVQDNKGRTPLFHAAGKGNIQVVRFLVERGADLEASTNDNHIEPGSTALMACAERNTEECFKLLMDKGANVLAIRKDGADATYIAARYGNLQIIQHIAATDKMKLVVNKATYRDRTPILTAAFHGHIKVCKALEARGAEINHQDDDKFTALIYAANEGHFDVVRWLAAEKGAKVNLKNKYGETAVTCADANGYTDVAIFLRKYNHELELGKTANLVTMATTWSNEQERRRSSTRASPSPSSRGASPMPMRASKGRASYPAEKVLTKKGSMKRTSR